MPVFIYEAYPGFVGTGVGAKIALFGNVNQSVISDLGAFPITIHFAELYAALQTGVIDGVAAQGRGSRDQLLELLPDLISLAFKIADPVEMATNGDDILTGTVDADSLHLLKGADEYSAGKGRDKVWGDAGADVLRGQDGNDTLFGGNGQDRLFGGNGADTINAGKGNDKLFGGDGADLMNGGKGNDKLFGGNGADTLNGGKGQDILDGGKGNDSLTGGTGADIFVFETIGQKNKDTITDFEKGVDSIRVTDANFSIEKIGGHVALRFGGGETLTLEGVHGKKGIADSIMVVGDPLPVKSDPALLFDLGGKFDKSFNESARVGAERWASETGDTFAEFELGSEAHREQALARFAAGDYDPVVVQGFAMADALNHVAPDNPDTSFAIVGAVVDQPNVCSYTFAEHEGAYVMGIIAAMASETETVGFIGGMDTEFTRRYSTAFEQGVHATDPDITILVNMTGATPAAWNDPIKASELAKAQISQDADVIFTGPGGSGIGALQAVSDAGVLAIGVDDNQNYLHPGNILTSMVKRYDVVVEKIFTEGSANTPGVHELGVADGAIDYAYDGFNKGLLTKSMRDAADAAMADIASGAIVVHDYYDIVI